MKNILVLIAVFLLGTSPVFAAKNSAVNLDITNNADGFDITGGTTGRKLTVTSSDVTVNQSVATSSSPSFSGLTVGSSSGLAKLTSGTIGTATSGTDYAPATSGSSILKGNGSGGFSNAASGTDYAPATSGSSILKGNGSGGFSNATSGTDYAPATSGSFILYGNNVGGTSNATVGSGLSFSGGTLSASGSGFSPMTTTVVTGTTQSASVNNAYYSNNAGAVTVTLPSSCTVGDELIVGGLGAGGWVLAQNASQLVHVGNSVTTTGTGGSLASTNRYDSIHIKCVVTNTTWNAISVIGSLTVV